jgi:GT2 family glycosyltransferase
MTCAALIANWNGSDCIERCVGSALAAARACPSPVRVIVIDDASTDDSASRVASRFPSVELIRLRENLGYAAAVNHAMNRIAEPWVFLLNNDIVVPGDFFSRMIEARNSVDPATLFAIGAKTVDWASGEPNHGGMFARWRGNLIVQEPFEAETLAPAHFVQTGAALVSREKFLALGGFSDLYHPAYWEDYDLSYQALRRGWKNYYEPRAVAHHWGKRSMHSLYGRERVSMLVKRNHLLFVWANLHDPALLRRHLLGLSGLMLRNGAGENESSWGRAFIEALPKLPQALRIRNQRIESASILDKDVLS